MAKPVTVDQIRTYAAKVEGTPLKTMSRRKGFTVAVTPQQLIFTPESTGKERPHDRKTLQAICDHFNKTGEFTASSYREVTYNASYTLALIHGMLQA